MSPIEFLHQRNSSPKLIDPAPSAAELEQMFQAAFRAPDHARQRPWRFLTIQGESRHAFGELMAEASALRDPSLGPDKLDKIKQKPLRAPLIVAAAVNYRHHPKVPEQEQLLAAGCAVMNLLNAVDALGYGAIWRTGANAFDPYVWRGLGFEANEELIGFIYIGSRYGESKPLPVLSSADFVRDWNPEI